VAPEQDDRRGDQQAWTSHPWHPKQLNYLYYRLRASGIALFSCVVKPLHGNSSERRELVTNPLPCMNRFSFRDAIPGARAGGRFFLTAAVLATLAMVPAMRAASGDETQVLFDGTHIQDWDCMRDQSRLDEEFSLSEITAIAGPAALSWRFVPRSAAFNDLFLTKPIERPFQQLRVLVRNTGAAFTFAAKVRDANGAEWTVPPVKLDTSGEFQWISFPIEQWKVASWSRDADGRLDFPLTNVVIIAFGLKSSAEYQIQVQRVEVVRPDPPVATIASCDVPERWSAGQTIHFSVCFSVDKPCKDDRVNLVLKRGGAVVLELPLKLPSPLPQVAPGQKVSLEDVAVQVPEYASGGEAEAGLQLGEAKIRVEVSAAGSSGQGGRDANADFLRKVTVRQRATGRTRAEVKPHRGVPTLMINDQPHSGMAWATYSPSSEVFCDFTRAGVDLFTFSGTPTEAGYGLSKTVWVGPDEFDYSEFDRRVLMLLQANPHAWFFPRLYLHAPAWWSKLHPDDVVQFDPGDGRPQPFVHSGGKPAPSWASEIWRRDTIAALNKFIDHVAQSPYADRVVGYHLASGTTEEWMMWGANEDQWVDYSPANVQGFRKWLRRKYATDAALQAAWADAAKTLDNAAIPGKSQRSTTRAGWLRDSRREQDVIDFYLYNSELVADTIGCFAKAVKDHTHREKIVGVFYGYLLQLCGEQRQQNAGHLALERVLASPDVDFVTSPTSYAFRQLGGEGTSHFMSLARSVQLHGKLWFDENDIRTSLSGGAAGEWGRPKDVAGDMLQQDKELANCIVNGAAQWWFDVGGNRYNHPALMEHIGKWTAAAGSALPLDRSPIDEVAFVVDERSLCFMRVGDPLGRQLLIDQIPSLHRIGAPVGHYLVSDLPMIKDKKLFIIPTSFSPTAKDRQAVDSLKSEHRVLVFLGAPGLCRDDRADEQAMFDFTGIRIRISNSPAAMQVTLKAPASRKEGWDLLPSGSTLRQLLDGKTYGLSNQTAPICYPEDSNGQVWGELADGRAGLIVRNYESWTAVYSAAPVLPEPLLRRLAQLAEVHQYIDTDEVVWANHDMVALTVRQPGKRTIRIPRTADVADLMSGSMIARECNSFTAEFAENGTRVFVLRSPAKQD
jgi:hypothetical protein